MSLPDWREEPVARQDRERFDCGDDTLNGFLRTHARKNHERGASKTFLAMSKASDVILGFYTLSPASAEFERVPERLSKGLGRYEVGGFKLARLAVDRLAQGHGLGGHLLLAAALRCIRAASEVGGTLMFIDGKDARVATWYRTYGALGLDDQPLALFLPLASFEAALRKAGKV
ncbi:GNAT family N-acetyltransferase [Mesorhizobium carmichaelinearum]|uniref:GNAT family N-acetyltransferase n=1 Tax=Mesorhizobium carmichaelinearum TaxID=1208188 RepID=UPI000BA480F1|nr:GNAT family N-acetyltransferase [Mesorhizobium carmichaelinearum]